MQAEPGNSFLKDVVTQLRAMDSKKAQILAALQRQWDHAANAHLGNVGIIPHSGRKVWWICHQCPDGHLHSWEAAVYSRTRGGCPQCSGPLLAEWGHGRDAVQGPSPPNKAKKQQADLGSAPSVQWGKSTAGLHGLSAGLVAKSQAVHSVLGSLLANATPCRRSTLA